MKETPSAVSRLLASASEYRHLVVMAHDNPDPDAIASGWGLVHLFHAALHRRARFIAGGEIIRAENRKMLSLLHPPLHLGETQPLSLDTLLILIDCDVDTTNHPRISREQPVAVIDHHVRKTYSPHPLVFQDRRPDVTATATIVSSYLRECRIRPSTPLATALLYAIRTETKGGETHYSDLDHSILTWLTGHANPSQVIEIEEAPLGRVYFSDVALALQNTFLYEDSAFCILPQCHGPEIVGEVADLLIRCDGVSRVLCGAYYRSRLILSVRTRGDKHNAVQLTLQLLQGIGHGGGHPHRAGGIVEKVCLNRSGQQAFLREFRKRWLTVCGLEGQRGERLVSLSQIVRCL